MLLNFLQYIGPLIIIKNFLAQEIQLQFTDTKGKAGGSKQLSSFPKALQLAVNGQ